MLTSPLQRAARTCDLAGFSAVAVDRDLVEWNYGDDEGLRTVEIRAKRPDWQLFRDGCPHGESPKQVGARADRVVSRVRPIKGDVLIFSSGHFLRVFAARWLGLEAAEHLIQSQLFCEPALGNFVVGLTTMITHVSASVSLARLGPMFLVIQ